MAAFLFFCECVTDVQWCVSAPREVHSCWISRVTTEIRWKWTKIEERADVKGAGDFLLENNWTRPTKLVYIKFTSVCYTPIPLKDDYIQHVIHSIDLTNPGDSCNTDHWRLQHIENTLLYIVASVVQCHKISCKKCWKILLCSLAWGQLQHLIATVCPLSATTKQHVPNVFFRNISLSDISP